jgi:hypothetical protein
MLDRLIGESSKSLCAAHICLSLDQAAPKVTGLRREVEEVRRERSALRQATQRATLFRHSDSIVRELPGESGTSYLECAMVVTEAV